jgi:magnesium-protoporphyrin IX monomethyl ester (oxidative) cyclase
MDILFTVMPFADLYQPALGVSLLKAAAQAGGFTAGVRYFTFPLAERIGADFYRNVLDLFGYSLPVGEWLFAESLFGPDAPPAERFVQASLARWSRPDDQETDLSRYGRKMSPQFFEENVIPRLRGARQECSRLVDEAASEVLAAAPKVAAFTVGIQQLCASLAVARRLKEVPNGPVVLFGGSSCFGELGQQVLRSFPWVDYMCTGEGDQVVPEFLHRLLRDGNPDPPRGILARGATEPALPPLTRDPDGLPYPDFHDYFARLDRSPVREEAERVAVPMETSRGCWWGERRQCGFCNNHPKMQTFRSKSPERVVAEMTHIVQTYRPRVLYLTDSILDRRYFHTLFPLIAEGQPVPFTCASKVNLTRAQLRQLRAAGCATALFGIESLSNRLLALLPKGCATRHAIQTLRWAHELGINAGWNFLYGIAGETPEDYEAMAEVLPLLAHLPPPQNFVDIAIMRFSPYREKFRTSRSMGLHPVDGYALVFPLPREEIEGLAYYFVSDRGAGEPSRYVGPVRDVVAAWIDQWQGPDHERPRLDMYRVGPSAFLVIDTRPCAVKPAHRLEGVEAHVYNHCDKARKAEHLVRDLAGLAGEEEIREALAKLVAARLLWRDGDRFVALALFRNREEDRRDRAV